MALWFGFVYLFILALASFGSACEGECITGITAAFNGNYSLPVHFVLADLSDQIDVHFFPDARPTPPIPYLAPLLSAYEAHKTSYLQHAIFPSFFHGKCQDPTTGLNPPGCPNPNCPVVCGTPGSMVHFYARLRFIAFNATWHLLHELARPGGEVFEDVRRSVESARNKERRDIIIGGQTTEDSEAIIDGRVRHVTSNSAAEKARNLARGHAKGNLRVMPGSITGESNIAGGNGLGLGGLGGGLSGLLGGSGVGEGLGLGILGGAGGAKGGTTAGAPGGLGAMVGSGGGNLGPLGGGHGVIGGSTSGRLGGLAGGGGAAGIRLRSVWERGFTSRRAENKAESESDLDKGAIEDQDAESAADLPADSKHLYPESEGDGWENESLYEEEGASDKLILSKRDATRDALKAIFNQIRYSLEAVCGGSGTGNTNGLPYCSWEYSMKEYILTFP